MAEALKKSYGEAIKMAYVDVVEGDIENYPDVDKYLDEHGMVLPLVRINGVILGHFILNYTNLLSELRKIGIVD